MSSENSYKIKAEQLDLYRWLLLREKHACFGSALRFLRDALRDSLFGLAAKCRLASKTTATPCDFLLLQAASKVIPLQRKKLLMQSLRGSGFELIETALPEYMEILSGRTLCLPPQSVPLRYFGYAAYAEWLRRRYKPKILLNDRNGSLYAPFIRLALNSHDALLVHLAHATTLDGSQRLSMMDYDYYILFGRSSLESLQQRRIRFGNTMAVLAGSHMIDHSYEMPPPDPSTKTMLVLGVGPDKEKLPDYQRTYQLLREWAACNPQYRVLVKAHQRSDGAFWREAERVTANIRLLPKDIGLAEALGMSSIAVNIMSNAVIEATLAGRPMLYVNCGKSEDIFSQARFFGGVIDNLNSFDTLLASLERDYEDVRSRSARFVEYHLASGTNGLNQTLEVLKRLINNQSLESDCELITQQLQR